MSTKKIKIMPNRQLKSKNNFLGVTGEKQATVLEFIPGFSEINGTSIELHTMRLIFNNAHGSYVKEPNPDNTYYLPLSLTVDRKLKICVQFLLGEEVKWSSVETEFIFAKGADDSNTNYTTEITEEIRSELNSELSDVLSVLTGTDYSETSWNELFTVISGLTYIDDFKSALNARLPRMHFDKMNSDQFKYSINKLFDSVATEPDISFVVDLTECSTDLDDDGNLVIDEENDMPVLGIEYKTRYSQSQLDGAVNEKTEELAAALTDNFGEDYTGDTWEELVGVYEEFESGGSIIVPDEGGGVAPPSAPVYHYQHGALWQLRTALKELYDYITPFLHTTSVSAPPACYASITSIESDIDYIKDSIVTAINETLEPEEPLTLDCAWYDIVEAIRELPSDVGMIITQSVGDSSDGLRGDVDRVINQIITEYDLSTVTVTGTWDATLNNLIAVCDAISEIYEGRIESIEDNIDALSLSIEAVTGVRPSNFLEFKNLIEEFNPSLKEAIEAATGDAVDEGLLYEDLVNLVKDMQTGGEVTPQSVYIPFSFTEEDGEKIDLAFVTNEDGLPCIITGEMEE